MPRTGRTRRLWLHVKAYAPKATSKQVKNTLIDSIERGDYKYPKTWKVVIGWRNSFYSATRWGEFTVEMRKSRESSPGFDEAVIDYLERM